GRGAGALLAAGAILVHPLAADAVAARDLLGRLQHAPVDLRLGLEQAGILGHVAIRLVLDAGDRFDPAGDEHLALARDDALGGHGDRLQAGGTEAVDGRARDADGASRGQGDLARDVAARRALG